MKLTCSDCGRSMFKREIGREHHDWLTGETSYRCRACAERRVARLIVETKRKLGTVPR